MKKKLVSFTEIEADGEIWESFARDFLQELGFFIERVPDRGADGGKDLLITEQLQGTLNKYKFRWLVSCKNYAKSNSSVTEKDEVNLLERLDSFNADGFIGFYSTLPSSGLSNRLNDLRKNGKIKDYRIFDSKLIENYLIRIGFSKLLMRYFPDSYKRVKPTHLITDEFISLECVHCGKEIIESLNYDPYQAIICQVIKIDDKNQQIIDVYWACKGDCDRKLEKHYHLNHNAITYWWEDITDLVIPAMFIKWILAHMNTLRENPDKFTEEAYKKEKYFILAICQKVLREMTQEEWQRFRKIVDIYSLF